MIHIIKLGENKQKTACNEMLHNKDQNKEEKWWGERKVGVFIYNCPP